MEAIFQKAYRKFWKHIGNCGINEIDCSNYEAVYFDKSTLSLKSRSSEHRRSVKNCNCRKNEIGKHWSEAPDNYSSNQKKAADRESTLIPEKNRETIHSNLRQLIVTYQESDIPVKIIKVNKNFFAEAICFHFNKSFENGKFPNCQKLANITSVFKKGPRTSRNNYRPVSILPVFSKIFESLLRRQLLEFFDNILSKFQCDFRKGYGTQHCLLLMLEIWKEATDNNKAFGALLTDLSKAFDCLSHDLLIAKLHAYGLDIDSLNILQDYLSNRKQRTKVDSFYSSWEPVLSGAS